MKTFICEACGSREYIDLEGYRECAYCGVRYQLERYEYSHNNSIISVNEDVQRLLEKCHKEPWNARKYANLILDIDSTNSEAQKYLK